MYIHLHFFPWQGARMCTINNKKYGFLRTAQMFGWHTKEFQGHKAFSVEPSLLSFFCCCCFFPAFTSSSSSSSSSFFFAAADRLFPSCQVKCFVGLPESHSELCPNWPDFTPSVYNEELGPSVLLRWKLA